MHIVTDKDMSAFADPKDHIRVLREAFRDGGVEVPQRQYHQTSVDGSGMLIMPAWGYRGFMGVKLIASTPSNRRTDKPYLQGTYSLFDRATGTPLAQLDAPSLTNMRTAAASALASTFLSHPESKTLLMVGAGSLAPFLIRAHRSVRPIGRILIWSPGFTSAEKLAGRFEDAEMTRNLMTATEQADIISCATPSTQPLIDGDWLHGGQHLDLVGGYKPEMRETDDKAIARSSVFIDTPHALDEAGDLIQPLHNDVMTKKDIKATLFELCRAQHPGRTSHKEITLFKSVGHALEDLALAAWVWERYEEIRTD